jgi:VCBS repeat-containing protein
VAAAKSVTINDVTLTEGNSGTTTATFTVSTNGAGTGTVEYATSAGTATQGTGTCDPGEDYIGQSGVLAFTAGGGGNEPKSIVITICGDTAFEPNETFVVTLSNPTPSGGTGMNIGDGTGVGTITNDDAANTAPVVTAPANQAASEGSATSFLLGSFTDAGPSPWSVDVDWGDGSPHTTFSQASAGTITAQSHTYADGPATHTVTVTVTDNNGAGLAGQATFIVTVNNVAPTTTFFSGDTTVDESDVTTHTYVFSIFDPGADTIIGVGTSCGVGGTPVGGNTFTNTTVTFTCMWGNGPADPSIQANATDDDNATGPFTFQPIHVNNVAPVANNDSATTNEDTAFTEPAPGVLGNDTDVAADSLSVGEVNGVAADVGNEIILASGATLTLNATGSYTYNPNGAFDYLDTGEGTTDSFTYAASDGTTLSNTAMVTITITGVNDAPVCLAVDILTDEDTAGSTAPDCIDVDGEPLTYTVTDAVLGDSGTDGSTNLTFDPDGAFESLDDTGEFATDAFMYTASDGDASSVPADVNVTITGVNDAPVANDDTGTTNEDTNLVVAAPGVLANDTDVDVEPLTVAEINGVAASVGTAVTLASGATVTLNADGSFTYTPSPAHQGLDTGESATDSFTYAASDGTALSNNATVTITITGVNDAPVAGAITTTNNTLLEGQSTSVTLAFSDVDIESHTCTFVWSDGSPNTVISASASATDCTASHTYGDDEPGAADDIYSVSVTVSDGDVSASNSIGITVSNVSPSLNTPVFAFNPFTGVASASINFSDPGWLDTHTATFSWGDGATTVGAISDEEHLQPDATGKFTALHTYGLGCVATAPTVTVKDDDGGTTVYTYVVSLDHYVVAFQAPIQDGARNIVKQGNVIPVKLQITDCAGNAVLGKTLSIGYVAGDMYDDDDAGSLLVTESVSGADTSGMMRQVDSKYMYNLATKTLTPGMPYTVVIREPNPTPGLFVASFVIQSKK